MAALIPFAWNGDNPLGFRPEIYQSLAQAAISASQLAQIEPMMLEALENGNPGVVCTLYRSKFAFSILVECGALPPVVGGTG